jgi:hypothetical protein
VLSRLAARLCLVMALDGKTLAGDSLRDSMIVAIDSEGVEGETTPFIAIYTDDQDGKALTISLELGVTSSMAVINPDTGEKELVGGTPPTDSGIELTLDVMERQVHVALADEENSWAELFRVLFTSAGNIKSVRGASKSVDGERFAGRQIIFEGEILDDPAFGRAYDEKSFWGRFLDKVDTEPRLAHHATTIRALLGDGEMPDGWRLVMRAMGLSRPAADALGVTPEFGDVAAPITDPQTEITQ